MVLLKKKSTCMTDHKTGMKPFRLTCMRMSFIAQQVGEQYSVSTREISSRLKTWGRENTNVAYYRSCSRPALLPTYRLAYACCPLSFPNGLVSDQSRSERPETVHR